MPPKKTRAASEAPSTISAKSIRSSRSSVSRSARAKSIPAKSSPAKTKGRSSAALRLTPAKQAAPNSAEDLGEEDEEESGDWVERLPTLTGLFGRHTTSLVASFARFIPFTSFRSPALPSPSALDGLLSCNNANRLSSVGAKEGIKHLVALQTYATALKNQLVKSRPASSAGEGAAQTIDPAVEIRLARLMEGCIVATGLCAHLLWTTPLSPDDRTDVHTALRQLLPASFGLYALMPRTEMSSIETEGAKTRMHEALLRALFEPSSSYGMLFARQHALVARLQHTTRQLAKSKASSGNVSTPITAGFPPIDQSEVTEAEAAELLDLLDIFTTSSSAIKSLPLVTPLDDHPAVKVEAPPKGRRKPKVDPEVQANHSRPCRIRLEAALARCELLICLATRDMADIKARSVRRLAIAEGLVQEETISQEAMTVEVKVEHALIECLSMARVALDENMMGVLTEHIRKGDWVHESETEGQDLQTASSAEQGDKVVKVERIEDETTVDSESEDDSDTSSSPSSDQDMVDLYPSCPLSTLFRLCERFEEMRLAVWLVLPAKHRGLMWVFMRGEEGRVGDVWDQLGQRLLLDMDRVELVRYGLGGDKVDQWVEVASKANAKRIRRRV